MKQENFFIFALIFGITLSSFFAYYHYIIKGEFGYFTKESDIPNSFDIKSYQNI